jgi:two-component system, sensor histidine kinase and response regulator
MKILIAEDDVDFRQLLQAVLQNWGYEVSAVRDGFEALEALREEDAPRLAILDWTMPRLDGLEVCRRVRNEIPKPYTYLMLLTSHQRDEDVIAGMEAGADDYLTKPLSTNELRVRLNAGKRIVELQGQLLEAQENLSTYASELEAANKDLESFSYTVANDILKTLLNIGDNSKAIQDLYCGQDQQCLTYTHRVYEKTKYLAQLIGIMLDFFRPTRSDLHRRPIDLSQLAADAAERVRQRDPRRAVTFRIKEAVTANGDRELLRIALLNLFDNAWKHTSRSAEPLIEFGVKEEQGKPVYFVRDNGMGFDMAEADRLFRPFQRLPGTDAFAGRGIGLATVARTIRRHGGKIWAEGEAGKGATFYFTLG